jgi:hypothetical protein
VTEAEWLTSEKPRPMLSVVWPHQRVRKLQLFALACVSLVVPFLTDPRSRKALAVYEAHIDGDCTEAELIAAFVEANRVPWEVSRDSITPQRRAAEIAADLCRITPGNQLDWLGLRDFFPFHLASAACLFTSRGTGSSTAEQERSSRTEQARQADLVREIFGNPFRPAECRSEWRTGTVLALAWQMYEAREFSATPILADALQDAGCDNEDILSHCRDTGAAHVRGCWALDLVLELP